MYKFENWTWCRCWLPLLGAIAGLPLLGIAGGVGVHVGGLDVVPLVGALAGLPLLAAIGGCHCWGCGGWVYTLVDWTWWRCWLPLMGAIAGCHCWAAIAGRHCWVPLLGIGGGVHGCTSWRIGRGDVAGCRSPLLVGIGGGWVYKLADWMW